MEPIAWFVWVSRSHTDTRAASRILFASTSPSLPYILAGIPAATSHAPCFLCRGRRTPVLQNLLYYSRLSSTPLNGSLDPSLCLSTMTRDQQSLQVPLRAASAQSQTPALGNESQEDLRSEKSKNRTSKASKVLGTTEIPTQQSTPPRDDASMKRRKARPSLMKSSLSPFPSANHDDADSSTGRNTPQLRVRASSPLLGVAGSNNAQDAAASKKTLHPSGSSNALFSYFSSRDTATADSNESTANGKQSRPDTSSQSVHSKGSKSSKRKLRPPRIDLSLLFPKPKPTGEPLLSPQRMVHSPTPLSAVGEFPRSPPGGRRYTSAQSPTQAATTTTIASVGPPPPVPPSAVLRPTSHRSAPTDRSSAISTETNWLDPPPHRTVRTSDMDTALQNYSAMQDRQHREEQRQWYQKEQERLRGREAERQKEKDKEREKEQEQQEKEKQRQQQEEEQRKQQQREQEEEQRRQQEKQHNGSITSQERSPRSYSQRSDGYPNRMSSGGWSKETYLSPRSRPQVPTGRRPSPSPERMAGSAGSSHAADNKSFASKKSTKSSGSLLANSDLSTSSVLCLSSSEDEDEDDDDTPRNSSKPSASRIPRESVTAYGDLEPEICTAAAAKPTQGRAVKRVDLQRQLSASMHGGTMLRSPTIHRNPSMSSVGRSSSAGCRGTPQRSSGIPTISEPSSKLSTDQFPAPAGGNAVLSAREISRRSRVIAVTRQEETLLEAMRQRKGKVTPSLFHEARYSQNTTHSHPLPTSNPAPAKETATTTTSNTNTTPSATHTQNPSAALLGAESDQTGTPPSRDSEYSAEMSFLRLSASIQSRTDEGAAHTDKDGHPSSSSQGTASDAEQKTLNSSASPRTSLGYTESLPSPSTSGTSPLTPTLPIHRFSTLSTQSPPPTRPPPAVPTIHDQRRHSRRRTDSSEAIVLGEDKSDTKEAEEFPIWALGWTHDQNMTTVH